MDPTGEKQLKRPRGDDVVDCAKKAKIVGSNGIDPRTDPRTDPRIDPRTDLRTNLRTDLTDSHCMNFYSIFIDGFFDFL